MASDTRRLMLNGLRFVASFDGEALTVIDPYTTAVIATIPKGLFSDPPRNGGMTWDRRFKRMATDSTSTWKAADKAAAGDGWDRWFRSHNAKTSTSREVDRARYVATPRKGKKTWKAWFRWAENYLWGRVRRSNPWTRWFCCRGTNGVARNKRKQYLKVAGRIG